MGLAGQVRPRIIERCIISAKYAKIIQTESSAVRLTHRPPHGKRPLGTQINGLFELESLGQHIWLILFWATRGAINDEYEFF